MSRVFVQWTVIVTLFVGAAPISTADEEGERTAKPSTFTFVRAEYDSDGGIDESYYYYEGRIWQRWETDYPEAEENFLFRLQQVTTIACEPKPISMRLTHPELNRHPFIYMSDVGWQNLRSDEQKALRDYLTCGGFLWVDDFWGTPELDNFVYNMRQVFPDLNWRDIPKEHPIMNIVFPIEECPQIPAKVFARMGQSYDPPEAHRGRRRDVSDVNKVNFRGLFDENNRLMAVITHNSDVGDGWEREAEEEWYFEQYSIPAYAMGINIIVYALTH